MEQNTCNKCGRPMQYATEPKCNYCDSCMSEYCGCKLGRIKEIEPTCDSTAVIPSITVESVEGITNLANCLVHVNDINTTYYVDDKHRIMITWAGPVNIPGYDMEGNPNNYKNQIVTDVEAETAVIYDNHGKGYIFGITPENLQQAINDKLDEMAESGELTDIIMTYLNISKTLVFNNVAEMIASTYPQNGYVVRTLGFYVNGDKGGCTYKITNTTPNDYYIVLDNGTYAIPQSPDIRQLGAKGTQELVSDIYSTIADARKVYPTITTNDLTLTIDTYVTRLSVDKFYNCTKVPMGTFYLNGTITITTPKTYIQGVNKYDSEFKYIVEEAESTYIFDFLTSHIRMIGIGLIGPYTVSDDPSTTSTYIVSGIHTNNSSNNYLKDMRIRACNYGLRFASNSYLNTFENIRVDHCQYGFHQAGDGPDYNANRLCDCQFQYCKTGARLSGGRSQLLENCDFEKNTEGFNKASTGDVTLLNCYFEDYMRVSSADSVLVQSCSFWAGDAASTRTPYIRYHGTTATKITIQNCDFVSRDAGVANCAVKQYNGSTAVNPQTVKPTMIENSTKNMELIDSTFRGTVIKHGMVTQGVDRIKYISLNNTPSYTIDGDSNAFRIASSSTTTGTITLPTMTADSPYQDFPTEYRFFCNPGTTSASTLNIGVSDSSTQQIYGQTSFVINSDLDGKMLVVKYLGYQGGKYTWGTFLL